MRIYLRSMALSLLTITALTITAAGGRAYGAETGASCDFLMQMDMPVRSRGGLTIPQKTMTIRGKAWQSGSRARINMIPDNKSGHVVILTPSAVFTLDPAHKQAVKKPMTAALREKMFGGFPLLFLSAMDPAKRWKDAKKVGTESLDGRICDIWKVNLPSGPNQVASIWVPRSGKASYPVRAKMSVPTPQYANGKLSSDGPPLTCTVNASHFETNRPISETQFAVPAGYIVQAAAEPQGRLTAGVASAPQNSSNHPK